MTNDTTFESPDRTRRNLLRILGLTGAAAVAVLASPGSSMGAAKRKVNGVIVYRLSVRKRSTCKACASHHRRFAFATHALANAGRAHPGCNCPIKTQRMRTHTFHQLFPKGGTGVADLGGRRA
jgi:hypothetical protein